MSLFGKNIKKIRSVRGLTQAQLADAIDVSRGVISSYEEGRAEPKIETIIKTAEVFNLTIDQLLKANLTVNQLSGFSIPEIPEKDSQIANNISKQNLAASWIDSNAVPFLSTSIHHKNDFEYADVFFAQPKTLDFWAVMLVESQNIWYLGMPKLVDDHSIEISGQVLEKKLITQSFEVMGTYQSLKSKSLHARIHRLEEQMQQLLKRL
jgi:transcriptional regulator with XRE-family HTH domain